MCLTGAVGRILVQQQYYFKLGLQQAPFNSFYIQFCHTLFSKLESLKFNDSFQVDGTSFMNFKNKLPNSLNRTKGFK